MTNVERRRFLAAAGVGAGLGALALSSARQATATPDAPNAPDAVNSTATLNFLLNLEYLQAEFYSRAEADVSFGDPVLAKAAHAFAFDEVGHVEYLRGVLGSSAVTQPVIDFAAGFTALASEAGLVRANEAFDAFTDDLNFLLGAFVLEDVAVTAYRGAVTALAGSGFVDTAAGLLGVEAYQAGFVRGALLAMGRTGAADAISSARARLSGGADEGFEIGLGSGAISFAPADDDAMVFGRTPGRVLNVLYANAGAVTSGGFFPAGVNGDIRVSG